MNMILEKIIQKQRKDFIKLTVKQMETGHHTLITHEFSHHTLITRSYNAHITENGSITRLSHAQKRS